MATPTFTSTGSKATTPVKLDSSIFGIKEVSTTLIKQAYLTYQDAGRQVGAVTLTRGLVRGGGRKPWKQKGTGRARVGSIRSPIWRGGGITFGPTGNENYTKKLSKNSKKAAVKQALSLAATANKISVIDAFKPTDGKTKTALDILNKIGAERRILIVVKNITTDIARSTSNLSKVKAVQATYLNVFDILNADHIVIEKSTLETISGWLNKVAK